MVAGVILIDLCAYYTALSLSFAIRSGMDYFLHWSVHTRFTLDHFLEMPIPPLIIISIIAYRGLYSKRMAFWDEALELIKIIGFAGLIITTIVTMGKLSKEVSRLLIVTMCISSVFIFPLFRLLGKKLLYQLGIWNEKILIIGAGVAGYDFARGIIREKHMGYTVVGFLDDDPAKQDIQIEIPGAPPLPVLGPIAGCAELVQSKKLHALAIAIPSLGLEKQAELVNTLQKHIRRLLFVPEIRGIALANTNLYHLFDEELFILRINNNLKSATNRFYKAIFDFTVTILALPFIATILLACAAMIRLDSPGPALFTQRRLGRNGKTFKFFKFRTMYEDNDAILKECLEDEETCQQWEKFKKIKGEDPRVTRVGKFLRRTSLDELPQLLNILKGDMSLVGPRPYLPREIDDMAGLDKIILETKPGLTGLWQVSGRNRLSFDKRLRLDMWYVRNWSLWIDIVMILKTVKVVLRGDGAY